MVLRCYQILEGVLALTRDGNEMRLSGKSVDTKITLGVSAE